MHISVCIHMHTYIYIYIYKHTCVDHILATLAQLCGSNYVPQFVVWTGADGEVIESVLCKPTAQAIMARKCLGENGTRSPIESDGRCTTWTSIILQAQEILQARSINEGITMSTSNITNILICKFTKICRLTTLTQVLGREPVPNSFIEAKSTEAKSTDDEGAASAWAAALASARQSKSKSTACSSGLKPANAAGTARPQQARSQHSSTLSHSYSETIDCKREAQALPNGNVVGGEALNTSFLRAMPKSTRKVQGHARATEPLKSETLQQLPIPTPAHFVSSIASLPSRPPTSPQVPLSPAAQHGCETLDDVTVEVGFMHSSTKMALNEAKSDVGIGVGVLFPGRHAVKLFSKSMPGPSASRQDDLRPCRVSSDTDACKCVPLCRSVPLQSTGIGKGNTQQISKAQFSSVLPKASSVMEELLQKEVIQSANTSEEVLRQADHQLREVQQSHEEFYLSNSSTRPTSGNSIVDESQGAALPQTQERDTPAVIACAGMGTCDSDVLMRLKQNQGEGRRQNTLLQEKVNPTASTSANIEGKEHVLELGCEFDAVSDVQDTLLGIARRVNAERKVLFESGNADPLSARRDSGQQHAEGHTFSQESDESDGWDEQMEEECRLEQERWVICMISTCHSLSD